MPTAYFCNTTTVSVALNLNDELQNHELGPGTIATDVDLPCWDAAVAANPAPGQLGTSDSTNVLVVFSEAGSGPLLFEVRVAQTASLDVYFYVFGDTVVGALSTGFTEGVTVVPLPYERLTTITATRRARDKDRDRRRATAAG